MVPESIIDHRARRMLEFGWYGGASYTVGYRTLRLLCPCAHCKRLRFQTPLQADWETSVPIDIEVTAMEPVGRYGVQLSFSDDHDRGIFPWVFLQEVLERQDRFKP